MWFNNALIFQCTLDKTQNLLELFATHTLKPCPPHARFIYGWAPVFGDELIQEVAGSTLFCMGKEERLLPRGVLNRELAERVQAWEGQHNRTMKRAEKAQLAEELEFELLPKSFCLQKKLYAYFDEINHQLIINTASTNQASQLIALLHKTLPGIHIEPIQYPENLALHFAQWVNQPASLPNAFQLASDCLLFSLDDEKKRFNCKGCELPAEEVVSLLSQGLAPAEISLIWNERIQLTLTHDFILKRLKCLDYLQDEFQETRDLEEEYQQRDAALTLLSGELRALFQDLNKAVSNTAQSINEHNKANTINELSVC